MLLTISTMKPVLRFLFDVFCILVIDVVLIWLWVYQMDPEPSSSLVLILLVPFVFCLNLLVTGILFWLKRKRYGRLFLLNSILASIIMYNLYNKGIGRYLNKEFESWEFKKADTTFSLIRDKHTDDFSMGYRTEPGRSTGFLNGVYSSENGVYILTTDSTRYIVKGNYLIGFKKFADTIQMKKIDY